ncbi:MAG: hypothetical protein NTY02_18895, partial [Acidobacteria bacterium]|nr:hypothetical protein [Acidobacteriota bacterium]
MSQLNGLLALCGAFVSGDDHAATLRLATRMVVRGERTGWRAQAEFAHDHAQDLAAVFGGMVAPPAILPPAPGRRCGHGAIDGVIARFVAAARADTPPFAPPYPSADLEDAAAVLGRCDLRIQRHDGEQLQVLVPFRDHAALIEARLGLTHPLLGAGLATRLTVAMEDSRHGAERWAGWLNAVDGAGGGAFGFTGGWTTT